MAQEYREKASGENKENVIQNAQDLYVRMVGKPFDLIHWWALLKDQPKWETFSVQSTEASSKWLRINEVGSYSESVSLANPAPPTPLAPQQPQPMKIHQLKKLGGSSVPLEGKPSRERQMRKYRI